MKRKRLFLFLMAILLLGICLYHSPQIVRSIVAYYVDCRQERLAYPNQGEYICSDLGMRIDFGKYKTMVYYQNGEEPVHIDFYGRMIFESGVVAFYYWDKKDDVLEIEFHHAMGTFEEDTPFYFIQNASTP